MEDFFVFHPFVLWDVSALADDIQAATFFPYLPADTLPEGLE